MSARENPRRYFLDITGDVCPLTFVKTKLLLERLSPGDIAEIRLTGAEPVENVPRSVREDGHEIVAFAPEQGMPSGPEAIYRLVVRRA
ncbi:MAG: sulfurtransferase TusA family protein [Alphaproteobacteria bacterium]